MQMIAKTKIAKAVVNALENGGASASIAWLGPNNATVDVYRPGGKDVLFTVHVTFFHRHMDAAVRHPGEKLLDGIPFDGRNVIPERAFLAVDYKDAGRIREFCVAVESEASRLTWREPDFDEAFEGAVDALGYRDVAERLAEFLKIQPEEIRRDVTDILVELGNRPSYTSRRR